MMSGGMMFIPISIKFKFSIMFTFAVGTGNSR
jgi:hypothetical protein